MALRPPLLSPIGRSVSRPARRTRPCPPRGAVRRRRRGTLDRAQLLVYRHRNRALAVRARSKELGVAWVVARVAPHRPAPRLVAEDDKARRVLPRARRIGGSPLEYLALARAGLEIEEITPYVAACE